MHIDGNIVPLFAMTVGLIIAVTRIVTGTITNYRLKVEQIKADALVRAEEIRSRNELELEKLMRQDRENAGRNPANGYDQSDMGRNPAKGFERNDTAGNPSYRNETAQYEEENRNTGKRVRE